MGLAASQSRFLSLTARQSDLEFSGQQINQQRMILAQQTQALFDRFLTIQVPTPNGNDTGNDSTYQTEMATYNAEVANINAETEIFHAKDRVLEMDLKNVDTQRTTVQTEMDAIKKVIDKNVEQTFKTFA